MKKFKKKSTLDSGIESDFSYVDEPSTIAIGIVPAADPVGATLGNGHGCAARMGSDLGLIVSPAATFPLSSLVTAGLGPLTDQSIGATLVYARLEPTAALINPTANPVVLPNDRPASKGNEGQEGAHKSPSDQPVAAIDAEVYIEIFSNDPKYTDGGLWGMYGDATPIANAYGSQAGEAWAAGYTGSGKGIVGVIDTGIDYTHPDLYLNVWLNQGEISNALRPTLTDVDLDGLITFHDLNNVANATRVTDINLNGYIDAGDLLNDVRWENSIDENGNGYVDDLVGWDFFNNDNDPFDDNSHGTHVSGTIGAIGGNGSGVVGVNWAVQMVGLKFLSATGSGATSGAILAIDYFTNAATQASAGENFIATNNSWGGGGASQGLTDAVTRAAREDILFIAAAGNETTNNDVYANYPSNISTTTTAGYEAVIAVASLTASGRLSSFSNFGATTVDLAAPGSSIYSTLPGGTYGSYSGTSMATPHVTGAAALYAALHPTASAAQIQQALLASAAPTTSLTSVTASGGRLDIGTLMGLLPSLPPVVEDIAGTTATTATLTTSAPQTSIIAVAGDQDWFKVELVRGYRYDFALDAAAGSGHDTYLRLMDGRGTELLVNDDAVGLNSRLSFTANTTETYFVSAQGYSSSVGSYALNMTADIGSLVLVGSNRNDVLVGGAGADQLSGLAGNDNLDGGLGADILIGGTGNDTYNVDNTEDQVIEDTAAGIDTVVAALSYVLTANVEKLTLSGSLAMNATGNDLQNTLTGNAANNILDGGTGADTMVGGSGNDTYYVDNTADLVAELSAAGTDTVLAAVSYVLLRHVENLTLLNSLTALYATGNAEHNTLTGNAENNTLTGFAGNDTLLGGNGNDSLYGGLGNDILNGGAGLDALVFNGKISSTNIDQIVNFSAVDDTIWLDKNIFKAFAASGRITDEAFNFGSGATQSDDRIIYNTQTGALLYDADGLGGAVAMQFAQLTGLTDSLSASDFYVI
jgi:Ca2+-binding RTX toxin-like protein